MLQSEVRPVILQMKLRANRLLENFLLSFSVDIFLLIVREAEIGRRRW